MLSPSTTNEIIQNWRVHQIDKSSVDVQIGLLSEKILIVEKFLHGRVRVDESHIRARLTLIKLIGQRRKLLNYLKNTATSRYKNCINRISKLN